MRTALPLHKKILFSLFPTLLLLGILAAAELSLGYLVPSLDEPFATVVRYNGIDWYQVNRGYLERYFPSGPAMLPEFKQALFRRDKPAGSVRVFCLGESSMFGTPYTMNATIPSMLRGQLRRLLPGREIEVVNLGAAAINSNVIADIAPLLPRYSPDLVILYAGHNEFYGPDGAGASFLEKWFPPLTQLKYRLRSLRLVRFASRLLTQAAHPPEGGANLMREVSRGAQVPLESDDARRVFANFARNLRAIAEVFRGAGIPFVVGDVSSNLMFPPFAPEAPEGFGGVARQVAQGEAALLRPRLERAASGDTGNAFFAYWLGRCLLAQGDSAGARRLLERARDLDLLKFRAPRRIDEIIHAVCDRERIPLAGVDSAFTALSPGGITGSGLFWEHLHPTAFGYYTIAGTFLRTILDHHLLPQAGRGAQAATLLPFNTDSLSIPWLELAYADLAIQHLTTRWPFKDYRAPEVVMKDAGGALARLATEVYRREVPWKDGCYRSAALFQSGGQFGPAEVTYRGLLEDYPYDGRAHYLLANLYKASGRLPGAIREYASSIRLDSLSPYPRIDLALLLINQGRVDEADAQLRTALALAPPGGGTANAVRASALYGLSAIAANRERFSEAAALAAESLRLDPSYAPAADLQERLRRYAGR